MQHLDEGTIHAWLDGALPSDEQMLIEQHVRECRDCAVLVADARGMIAGASRIISTLDNVPGSVIPAKRPVAPAKANANLWRSLRLTPFRAGLAATLMIAAASMFAVRRGTIGEIAAPAVQSRSDDRPARPASAPLALPPAAAPAPVVATTGAAPAATGRTQEVRKASAAAPRRDTISAPAADVAAAVVAAAPPPPSSANVARDEVARADVAKTKTAAPVAQPPQPMADARMATARERVDSMSRSLGTADSARSARGALGGAGAFAQTAQSKPTQLMEVVTTSAKDASLQAAPLFLGCYRVDRDSLGPLSALPERFALDQTGSPPGVRNVVRFVKSNGEMDTVQPNATWQSLPRSLAMVTWTVGAQPMVLRMGLGARGTVVATADVDGGIRSVQLIRTACSR